MKHLSFAAVLALLFCTEVRAQDTVRTFSQRQGLEPCRVEVAFNKTLHILFPSEAVYVDLGSLDLTRTKRTGRGTSCASKPRNRASRERRTFRSSRPTDASTLSRWSIPRILPGSTSRWRTGCTKIPTRILRTGRRTYVSTNSPGRRPLRSTGSCTRFSGGTLGTSEASAASVSEWRYYCAESTCTAICSICTC